MLSVDLSIFVDLTYAQVCELAPIQPKESKNVSVRAYEKMIEKVLQIRCASDQVNEHSQRTSAADERVAQEIFERITRKQQQYQILEERVTEWEKHAAPCGIVFGKPLESQFRK